MRKFVKFTPDLPDDELAVGDFIRVGNEIRRLHPYALRNVWKLHKCIRLFAVYTSLRLVYAYRHSAAKTLSMVWNIYRRRGWWSNSSEVEQWWAHFKKCSFGYRNQAECGCAADGAVSFDDADGSAPAYAQRDPRRKAISLNSMGTMALVKC